MYELNKLTENKNKPYLTGVRDVLYVWKQYEQAQIEHIGNRDGGDIQLRMQRNIRGQKVKDLSTLIAKIDKEL